MCITMFYNNVVRVFILGVIIVIHKKWEINMNKDIFKGFITCFCIIIIAIASIPVLAQSLSLDLNIFRIRNAMGTIVEWGNDYVLNDGRSIPSSIMHEGVVYLPVPLLNAETSVNIQFNGDSSIYTLLDVMPDLQYKDMQINDSYDIPDANNNYWDYSIAQGYYSCYLVITDYSRRFQRSYCLMGPYSYEFTDEYVLFAMYSLGDISLRKLPYASNPDNQDGYELYSAEAFTPTAIISDGFLYYVAVQNSERVIVKVDYESGDEEILHNAGLGWNMGLTLEEIQDGYLYFTKREGKVTSMRSGASTFYTKFKIKTDGTEDAVQLGEPYQPD